MNACVSFVRGRLLVPETHRTHDNSVGDTVKGSMSES